jgi:ADP-ribosylglycohydrolase
MFGAIAGDIAGSIYENLRTKRKDVKLFGPLSMFTDDTVLTVAVADAILTDRDYGRAIKAYARRHPLRGYGPRFLAWMVSPGNRPYNSFGNGSAMRVSPVAFAFGSEREVLDEARRSAECTHNHPEGIKGAQSVALAAYMARIGAGKESIRRRIEQDFGYNLSRKIDEIRPGYSFDITCQGSVPEAIIAFLDSTSYEDAVRNAISLGGDSDTQACIAGAIAEAFYKDIPPEFLHQVKRRLSRDLWDKALEFYRRYGIESILRQIEALDRKDEGTRS